MIAPRVLATVVAAFAACSANAGELIFHTYSWHSKPKYTVTSTEHYRYEVAGTYVYYEYDANGVYTRRETNYRYVLAEYDITTTNAYTLRNNTAGIGYVTDAGIAFGVYRNSYGKPTGYAGYQQKLPINGFSALLAGATGYKEQTGYTVSPFVAIDWTTKLYGDTTLHVTAIPALNNQMSSVVHFSVGYKFN